MLSSMRRLVASVGCLLLGANLALTVGHCMALRERAGRPRPAALFPEQRLRFAMDRAGALMLVEPERMMPKPNRDGRCQNACVMDNYYMSDGLTLARDCCPMPYLIWLRVYLPIRPSSTQSNPIEPSRTLSVDN